MQRNITSSLVNVVQRDLSFLGKYWGACTWTHLRFQSSSQLLILLKSWAISQLMCFGRGPHCRILPALGLNFDTGGRNWSHQSNWCHRWGLASPRPLRPRALVSFAKSSGVCPFVCVLHVKGSSSLYSISRHMYILCVKVWVRPCVCTVEAQHP